MPVELRENQRTGVALMQRNPRWGFHLDCGVGKTIMSLAGVREYGKGKWVVVCPISVVHTAWVRDAAAMGFSSIHVLAGQPPGERKRIIETVKSGVVVINFDVYAKHVDDFLRCGWRKLIVDEASRMKNHSAVQCKAILRHAELCERFYWLSGTPAPNGDHELWAVLRATRPDKVPASPWPFWSRYFNPIAKEIRAKGGVKRRVVSGWVPKPDREKELRELIASCTWTLRKEDCMDLPPQQDFVRVVRLSDAEREAYNEALANLRLVAKGGRSARIKAQSLSGKLRQLCGGWAYTGEDSGGVKAAVEYGDSKIQEMRCVIEEIGGTRGRPFLVWVDYRHDAARISAALDDMGITHKMLVGGGDDATTSVAAFQAGELGALVCHPQSVGHGVTVTRATDAIYYTVPWSWEFYKQSRDRIHRYTQTGACNYWILESQDTIDAAVLRVVGGKKKRHDELSAVLAEMGLIDHEPEHNTGD